MKSQEAAQRSDDIFLRFQRREIDVNQAKRELDELGFFSAEVILLCLNAITRESPASGSDAGAARAGGQ